MNTNRQLLDTRLHESQVGARALRILRTARGLSQKAVAERAGITPTQLSRYEKGAFSPRPHTLETVMEALDLPIEAFLEAQRLVRRLNRESRTVSPQRQEGYSLSLEQTSYISDQPFDEGASELETSESDRLAREIGRRVADLVLYLVDRRL